MRITLGLALSLTLILSTSAGLEFIIDKPPEVPPDSTSNPIDDPLSEPPYDRSPPETPGGSETAGEEDKQESDIAETLYDILDAITSIISLAGDGGTTTTITSKIPLPTAAYACLSAQNLLNSCSSKASSSYAVAGPSTVRCIAAGDPCVTAPAVASLQSRCLCPPVTGLFDDYLSNCNAFVQAQTQLATLSGLATAAFCTATDASLFSNPTASPTDAAPVAAFTPTGAASVLAPVMMSGESWFPVWWGVIVLVWCGWTGYG